MDNRYKSFCEEEDEDVENPQEFTNNGIEAENRIRLRAVATETEYFLPLLNGTAMKPLIIVQIISSIIIVICQILSYSIPNLRHYSKVIDYLGISIWGPIGFFLVAAVLTHFSYKSPTGCLIGATLGMQITTSIICIILLIVAIISVFEHGYYDFSEEETTQSTYKYIEEIPGKILCNIAIICSAGVIIPAMFVSIFFCRAVCCGRQRILDRVMFDVEPVD